MRIVIDLQGAQTTGSRNRGIGRYTRSLVRAILRNRGDHEVFILLSGLFPDTIGPVRKEFSGLNPQANIRVWEAPGPVDFLRRENDWRRKRSELLREAVLADLRPDIVLVSSLFEGLVDDALTSIGELSLAVPTAAILYDLIPLIHRSTYLENPLVDEWYETKLAHLRRADLLLAISESSRQEAINHLGFDGLRVVNISTAADPHFKPTSYSEQQQEQILGKYGLDRPYVMYTGGIDYRKNIEGLIEAFSTLPANLRDQHQLAIVCKAQPHDRERLRKLAQNSGLPRRALIITDFVPEDDLIALYNMCRLFVFPSWHEGFGLPALEAMSCGKAVIGSDCSSIPEVIGRRDALFNPRETAAIGAKIEQVLIDEDFCRELERHGLERSREFTWDRSAQSAIAAMERFHDTDHKQTHLAAPSSVKLKLAYISPLPPERSGISDYSAEILPALSNHYEIEVIVNQDQVSDPWVRKNCSIRSVEWFKTNSHNYDRILYHFGNSLFHRHMFKLIEDVPGIVVLHDFFLSGILAHLDLYDISHDWTQALFATGGYSLVAKRYAGGDLSKLIFDFPSNQFVLRNSLGVITHSKSSLKLAHDWYGDDVDDWTVVPLAREARDSKDKTESRRALRLACDSFIVCSFGLLGPSKLNHRLLNAWLHSELRENPKCLLVFVGQNDGGAYGQELLSLIRQSGLQDRILISGWVSMNDYTNYLAAADVGVQLRTLSRGETSASVLDCMSHGLPTIVNANGSLADLPDAALWKLPDDFEDEQLIEALESLFGDKSLRAELASRARATIERSHSPRTCALQYFQAIEGCYKDSAASLFSVVRKIVNCKPAPSEAEKLLPFAEAIDRSIAPRFSGMQFLVDVTDLMDAQSDEHDIAGLLRSLLTIKCSQYRVEPIAVLGDTGFRYARGFTLNFLRLPGGVLGDDPIGLYAGDVLLVLNAEEAMSPVRESFCKRVVRHGLELSCLVSEQFMAQGGQQSTTVDLNGALDGLGLHSSEHAFSWRDSPISSAINHWLTEHPGFRLVSSRADQTHSQASN